VLTVSSVAGSICSIRPELPGSRPCRMPVRPLHYMGSGRPASTVSSAAAKERVMTRTVIFALTLGLASATTYAGPASRDVTLPRGTVLPVTLDTTVGSDLSKVEQPVQGHLRRAVTYHGVEVLPAGAAVSGYVTSARRTFRVKDVNASARRRLDGKRQPRRGRMPWRSSRRRQVARWSVAWSVGRKAQPKAH